MIGGSGTKVLAMLDGRLGLEIGKYLTQRGEVSGVVLHPEETRWYVSEADFGRDVPVWIWPDGLREMRSDPPDVLLSVGFVYKITKPWLSLPRWGAANLHCGYLPFNRGRGSAGWPLIDGSPAGVTLHLMDEEFDTGPVLAREPIPSYVEDTRGLLAERLEAAALVMFRHVWPSLGNVVPEPQDLSVATRHTQRGVDGLVLAEHDFEVLDRMRAKTHGGGGIRFQRAGRLYEASVSIRHVRADPAS